MEEQQVYRLKVDSSGRIALPAETRDRHHIAQGDTVVIVDDKHGLHLKTLDQVLAEVQAEFAKVVPREFLRDLMDAKNAAPIIARMLDDRATDDDRNVLHLASFPKTLPPDIRRTMLSHLARVFTRESAEEPTR